MKKILDITRRQLGQLLMGGAGALAMPGLAPHRTARACS